MPKQLYFLTRPHACVDTKGFTDVDGRPQPLAYSGLIGTSHEHP
jgi:hypothetical protein